MCVIRTFKIYSLSNLKKNIIQCCWLQSLCYTLYPQVLFILELEVCIFGAPSPILPTPHPPNPCFWPPPIYSLCLWIPFFLKMKFHVQWYHTVFVLRCTWGHYDQWTKSKTNTVHVCVVTNGKISFCLWLNNIPVCVYIPVHTHTHTTSSLLLHLLTDT